MTKRLFQILDEMNQMDIKDPKRRVAISNTMVQVKSTAKKGGTVAMGVDHLAAEHLTLGDHHVAILLVVDTDVYQQLEKEVDQDIKNRLIDEQQQIEKDAAKNFGGL